MYDGSNGGWNPNPNNGTTPQNNGGGVPPSAPPPNPYNNPYNNLPPVISPGPVGGPSGSSVNALTVNYWLKTHWKIVLLIIIAVIIVGQTIFQIVYPGSRLIPGTTVDGVDVGGMKYADAAKKLDGKYGDLKLDIYFGHNDAAFQSPKMSDVGIGVDNADRLAAINYPFYLRFIPGSIWWAPKLEHPGQIGYTYDKNKISDYTISKVGQDCTIPPKNATLTLVESELQVVPSVSGGNCDINDFQDTLATVKPNSSGDNKVRIDINETPAPVTDDMARQLASQLNVRMSTPMPISVDNTTDTIPGRIVLGWLDFNANVPPPSIDNSANQQATLTFSVNPKRLEDYLDQGIASKLIIKPGVSRVSTHDFTETSRVNGANGRGVNMPAIVQSVTDYINNKIQQSVGATVVIGPSTVYTRSYTPTSVGFAALLAQYAQDNPGANYSMAFQELSVVDHPRSANYNGDVRMPSAGIHSLYLAYTDVMQEAAGIARPIDPISGSEDASDCFKDMIQKTDLGCRKGFYTYFGYAQLASRGAELGLTNTVFANEDTQTSANDLNKVMAGLFKNQVARAQNGGRILDAARASRSHDGIVAGAGTTAVTHIIGEDDDNNIYNDTALVYNSSYGAYALTVMSNGDTASWDKLKILSQKVIQLKSVKIPLGAR